MVVNSRHALSNHYDLISTSFHESGHTIYGLLNFMDVQYVQVYQDKKFKRMIGLTHYNILNKEVLHMQLENKLFIRFIKSVVCFTYAGLVAEKYFFKSICGSDKFPMFLREGSSQDTRFASSLISKYSLAPPGKKRHALKKKLIKQTQQQLYEHWDAVILIAHKLFDKKKISLTNIKKILTTETDKSDFWKQQLKIIDSVHKYGDADLLKSVLLK
jgi:hypothetical protein